MKKKQFKKENRYDSLFQYYADEYDLDWKWIKAQAIQESALNPTAVSNVGAKGLMQFMPNTWEEQNKKTNISALDNPFNVEKNIEAGCKYMRSLYSCFGEIPIHEERYKMALASYNGGRGNINKTLELARENMGLPKSYKEWKKQGEQSGEWQIWEYACKFLKKLERVDEKQIIDYVEKIENLKNQL